MLRYLQMQFLVFMRSVYHTSRTYSLKLFIKWTLTLLNKHLWHENKIGCLRLSVFKVEVPSNFPLVSTLTAPLHHPHVKHLRVKHLFIPLWGAGHNQNIRAHLNNNPWIVQQNETKVELSGGKSRTCDLRDFTKPFTCIVSWSHSYNWKLICRYRFMC